MRVGDYVTVHSINGVKPSYEWVYEVVQIHQHLVVLQDVQGINPLLRVHRDCIIVHNNRYHCDYTKCKELR